MGCCVSTTESRPDLRTGSTHQQFPTKSPFEKPDPTHVRDHRAPPPVPVEEESVKEVLSETPIVPKPQNPIPADEKKTVETKGLNLVHKTEKELSEASQISETENFSYSTATTTTTTITEKKDEEDEAMSKRSREVGHSALNRAEARRPRKRPYTGELPARRNIPARGPSEARTRRLNAGTPGAWRDSGEGSGRRSRSPATRVASGVSRAGVGRSPGKATGTAGSRSLDSGVQSKQRSGVEEEKSNDDVVQQGNESLENPLVSLECFIFL